MMTTYPISFLSLLYLLISCFFSLAAQGQNSGEWPKHTTYGIMEGIIDSMFVGVDSVVVVDTISYTSYSENKTSIPKIYFKDIGYGSYKQLDSIETPFLPFKGGADKRDQTEIVLPTVKGEVVFRKVEDKTPDDDTHQSYTYYGVCPTVNNHLMEYTAVVPRHEIMSSNIYLIDSLSNKLFILSQHDELSPFGYALQSPSGEYLVTITDPGMYSDEWDSYALIRFIKREIINGKPTYRVYAYADIHRVKIWDKNPASIYQAGKVEGLIFVNNSTVAVKVKVDRGYDKDLGKHDIRYGYYLGELP